MEKPGFGYGSQSIFNFAIPPSVQVSSGSSSEYKSIVTQDGKIQDLTSKNLILNYLKHPLMTFKVIVAIHYEAFKLWFKKVKLVKKNIKILNKITFETNEYK